MCRTRSAPSCRCKRDHRRRACARAPWCSIDGAQAVPHSARRRAGARLRLLRVLRRTSSTARPASACSYGREALLEAMPPWQGGGDMILTVTFEKTTYNELPCKFEAGTPNISGAVGLAAAIDYVESLGLDSIAAHEQRLLALRHRRAAARSRASTIIGTAPRQGGGRLLHDGGHPSARSRHDPRCRRRRRAHRPSLRHAGDGLLRRARHGARLVRLLQHAKPTSTRWSPR